MLRKLLGVIVLVILGVLGYYSTFGWQVTKSSFSVRSKENDDEAIALKRHVQFLSSQVGERSVNQYENLKKSAQYIADQLKQLGFEMEWQEFDAEGKKVYNIIGQKKGIKSPGNIILVGAHYDTYYSPGADNNASGVAVLLQLAEGVVKKPLGNTLRFVAFVNAEPPFFETPQMGSAVFLKRAKERNEKIQAVIIIDAVGYYSNKDRSQRYPPLLGFFCPDKGNFIALVGNIASLKLLQVVESIFRESTSLPVQAITGFDFLRSDHWVFWKEKYQAILVTDTGTYRNPYLYSLSDTYGMLNYRHMAQVVKALNATLEALGNLKD